MKLIKPILLLVLFAICSSTVYCQETKLLRQPDISNNQIVFVYGADIWTCDLNGQNVKRITSTPAIESDPYFSPDGKSIVFSSDRSGNTALYIVANEGGSPTRLSWHPSAALARGWHPNGQEVLYASTRDNAPTGYNKLWTVSKNGGPAHKITEQWGYDGSFSPDGKHIVLDRISRWDVEWRAYRGGQNTPLIILDLETREEQLLPHKGTFDIQPIWMGDEIYFLSDRDLNMNVWAFNPSSKSLRQVTKIKETPVKWLGGNGKMLIIEQNGVLHLVDPKSGKITKLSIEVIGDFPWAETQWEDVSRRATNVSLSPTGKRIVVEARGDIYTIPEEFGDPRNITSSSGAADREPLWSPDGGKIAWFSDKDGQEYALYITDQSGMKDSERIDIGESKMAWNPAWSPDGKYIAFTDDDVRIRMVDLEAKTVKTIDIGTSNLDRTRTGLAWSPESDKLAYVKTGSNNFRQIMIWDRHAGNISQLTDPFADAFSPAWDRDKKHFYFLASTDLALGSGWANTSAMGSNPGYAAYVVVLAEDQESPFIPRSDEEEVKEEEEKKKEAEKEEKDADQGPGAKPVDEKDKEQAEKEEKPATIKIDFNQIDRRTIPLPMEVANYVGIEQGPEGSFFVGERKPDARGLILHKFSLKDREAKEFDAGVSQFSISHDGKKILINSNGGWKIANAAGDSGKGGKAVKFTLKTKLDRHAEWKQMFEEAWRYERDYFYDPNMHGRDWNKVYKRYAPLVPFIKHRDDLTYILDQVNGELSVGHSFVFGGDYPEVASSELGLLGADFIKENNRWKISRIYTTESWNPDLSSPLDRPGLKVKEGDYLLGINGRELTGDMDPYQLLDGTAGKNTSIHISSVPVFDSAVIEIVQPIRNETGLRRRVWVEDNRRMVDKLSDGKLGYVWVPNTGGPGYVSFNRYFFAQQDKEGMVIDERFNGGGLLDDYMVDLMTRNLRAAITNEVPGGKPFRLPAGNLGPKVLLINEMAGSGGDFFPWVFRQQNAGKLIGARTWGGLVKSSVHYGLVDGGALTAPDNAVFDPAKNEFIGENKGIAPDIPVRQDAKALEAGRDPQLEKAVEYLLEQLKGMKKMEIKAPAFNSPAKGK